MRISDWSSDVCSSDLRKAAYGKRLDIPSGTAVRFEPGQSREVSLIPYRGGRTVIGFRAMVTGRSEEHTSELQSLMRISYAVFCLEKKKNTYSHKEITHRVP